MIRVSIVGCTGQVGESLIRVLLGHPECRLSLLVSRHAAGKPIGEILPSLRQELTTNTVAAEPEQIASASDFVFTATKDAESFAVVTALVKAGVKVVDIGGEFRLKNTSDYEQWYGCKHEGKDVQSLAVYGLPELNRQAIRNAQLTANPGCYATASTLALLPFLSHGLIETEGISIAAYSGLTGAGRQYVSSNSNLFVDIDGNLRAYAVGKHKHTPEIEQTCSIAAGKAVQVSFIPHLAPLDRGILATVFARAKSELSAAKAYEALHSFYSSERAPFVRVLQNSANVAVANVRNNNYCDLAAFLDPRTGMLVVHSAIDNLVKGAAGQAVQNMNLMMGFPEDLGLRGRSI